MLDSRHLWTLASRFPRAFAGALLHRWALVALDLGDYPAAERLFEAAATRYRLDLAVEPLARLRVHQLIGRVRATGGSDDDSEASLEVERLLTCLNRIESLEPPFELVDARSLLATWISPRAAASGAGMEPLAMRQAA